GSAQESDWLNDNALPATRRYPAVGVAVARQGAGVAVLHVAAHRAGDRDVAAGLGGIDRVVGRNGVQRDARGRQGRVDRVALGVGCGGAVEGRDGVGEGDIHRIVVGGDEVAGRKV